jgi:hypothetical protein
MSPPDNHRALATTTPHIALPATARIKTALPDPDDNERGRALLINNLLCDTGASAHATPDSLSLNKKIETELSRKILQFV